MIVIGLSVVLGMLALAAAIAWPDVLPVFRFPHPNGSYGIGTLTYHWVDTNRAEIFATDPSARRELMVQVWYPPTATHRRHVPSTCRMPTVLQRQMNTFQAEELVSHGYVCR